MSSQTAIIGCCGSSYGDRYIHSLVVNHRRFTAFTRGYASVPSYGGNARITTSCYNIFLFALGQWELSAKISSRLRRNRRDAAENLILSLLMITQRHTLLRLYVTIRMAEITRQVGTHDACVLLRASGCYENIACFTDARAVRPYLSSGSPAVWWGQ